MKKYKKITNPGSKAERDEAMREEYNGYIAAGSDKGAVFVLLMQKYDLSYSRVRQICRYNGAVNPGKMKQE